MRKVLLLLILLIFHKPTAFSQSSASSNRNFVRETIYKVAAPSNFSDPTQVMHKITYLDGLGRPLQTVLVHQGSKGEDIVTAVEYDAFGRAYKEILPAPVAGGMGNFVNGPQAKASTFYGLDTRPFSETIFESSPLSRVRKKAGPGDAWGLPSSDVDDISDKTVKVKYGLNDGSDVVRFDATILDGTVTTNTITMGITKNGFYGANQLTFTETTDEIGNQNREYKDKAGQVVLKMQFGTEKQLKTYYIYDDLGQLRAVFPPKLSLSVENGFTGADLLGLAFLYQYDLRGNLVKKKVPGAGVMTMTYDGKDRLTTTTDANGTTITYAYDALNRLERKMIGNKTFERSFYDGNRPAGISYDADKVLSPIDGNANIGQLTGKEVYYLSVATFDSSRISTGVYYNSRYQVVLTAQNGYSTGSGGATGQIVSNLLSYTGQVLKEKTFQTPSTTQITIIKNFQYDHASRLLGICHRISEPRNGIPVEEFPHLLNQISYNEIGQMIRKDMGRLPNKARMENPDVVFAESQTFNYNIRGWWNESFAYNKLDKTKIQTDGKISGATANFEHSLRYDLNGNISESTWGTAKGQDYTYDSFNRLKSAIGKTNTVFSEVLDYDENGNIKSLNRKDITGAEVDKLSYTYENNSNKLISVADAGTNASYPNIGGVFSYDANGNQTNYLARKVNSISYNILNLVNSVNITDKGIQNYTYAADGTKLGFRQASAKIKSYVGAVEYDGAGGVARIGTEEGYILKRTGWNENSKDSKFVYYYSVKDHLGNVRLVLDDESNAKLWQRNDYQAFGMHINQPVDGVPLPELTTINDRYYNGKEFDDQTTWLDYGARQYDYSLGRWMAIDPLADSYTGLTPNAYVFNNPVSFLDPFGLEPEWYKTMHETLGEGWMRKNGLTTSENKNKSIQELMSSVWNNTPVGGQSSFRLSGSRWGELSIFEDEWGDFDNNGSVDYWYRKIRNTGIQITRDETALDYVPIAGALRGMQDSNEQGNTKTAWFYGAMAISDIFLVKSLVLGGGRLLTGTAWKTGSHKWSATRSWIRRRGLAEHRQQVHHWFLHRNQGVGKFSPDWLKNQPWNLMNMPSQQAHTAVHEGGWLNYIWNGTPQGAKATIISGGGRLANDE